MSINNFIILQGILSFLSFRNYESLKLDITNYIRVGWRFALAALFYFCLFFYFLKKKPSSNTNIKINETEKNNVNGLNNELDNDKTEYFIENKQ